MYVRLLRCLFTDYGTSHNRVILSYLGQNGDRLTCTFIASIWWVGPSSILNRDDKMVVVAKGWLHQSRIRPQVDVYTLGDDRLGTFCQILFSKYPSLHYHLPNRRW